MQLLQKTNQHDIYSYLGKDSLFFLYAFIHL